MDCQNCPYNSMCEQAANPSAPCMNFDAFKREEEDWYQEEMQFEENMRNLYSYDENGFCDGFPR